MRWAATALAILLAASPVSAARPTPRLTLSQLRTHSAEGLARRLFGDLAPDMFVMPDRGPATGPRPDRLGPDRHANVWAWSRPTEADRPGLCRTDALIMNFEAVSGETDPAMRLTTFSARTLYIVLDRPRFYEGNTVDPGAHEACAAINPLHTGGIFAENSVQLARALSLFDELRAQAAAGRVPATLQCGGASSDSAQPPVDAACLRDLAGLDPRAVADVSHCSGAGEGPGGCIQLKIAEYLITFWLAPDRHLLRVRFELNPENIIVTAR